MPYTTRINTPINNVQLTNVAVVRMNKGGKRFEIACYRNKVVDYRQGLEQDLSEVLQTDRVFANVSKGEFAKAKDMQKVFGTKDEEEISKLILAKGQLQVSDKERSQQLEKTSAQIAEWISKNCVQPTTDRPYTISQIRHAMKEANVSIHPTKPLKRQYLDCVKLLQKVMPIQRAKMELLLIVTIDDKESMEDILRTHNVSSTEAKEDSDSQWSKYQILVDPSMYKILNDAMQTMQGSQIEIANQIVTKQGDVNLEVEVENNNKMNGLGNVEKNDDIGVQAAQMIHKINVSSEYNGDEDEENEIGDLMMSRRKAQKKNKKKNRKAHRRYNNEPNIDVANHSSLHDTGPKSLTGVSVESFESSNNTVSAVSGSNSDSSGRKSCNTCGGFFDSAAEFRAHFKSDWHRFNQKLKMKGCTPVSEKEFLMCDSDSFFASDNSIL